MAPTPRPPFYMVARSPRHPGSKTEPKTRYSTLDDARRAAQELAEQTGVPFVILSAGETIWPQGQQSNLF